ncbi:MAG: hypothetical protein SPF56_05900 [Bacteroidaceae bacterium]|nr:hypothetical protein [Prevotellaceae bacterium]MDY5632010.1 hypothetical protein [Bacteroidaceae bacterium]
MTEYKSEVKYVGAPIERVYALLSDLENLRTLQQNAADPALRERIMQQAGDKVKPEQIDMIAERLKDMQLSNDAMTVNAGPLGNVTLRIVEREATKLVKMAVEGLPMAGNIWLQMLPNGEAGSALRVTLGADLNFMMKQMLKGKLQKAADGLADMLCMLPY